MKNLSRVFPDQNIKKILEETWRDWVSKLNSRLSFYCCLLAVEKCLDKSLISSRMFISNAQNNKFRREILEGLPVKLKGNYITLTNTLNCALSLNKIICKMNFVIWLIKFSLINLVLHSKGAEMQESLMIVCLIILIIGRLTLDRILWNHSRPLHIKITGNSFEHLVEEKPTKKVFWPKFGPKLRLKLGFLPFSQVCFINFLLNCLAKKKIKGPNLGQTDQNLAQN